MTPFLLTETMYVLSKDYLRGPHSLMAPDGTETPWAGDLAAHRWMPGDCVDPATGAVVERTPIRTYVGIVDFTNRTTQGFSPRGAPLYLFYPLARGAPPFLVAAKERHTENQFAIVAWEHWDGKWPRGGIQRLLGPVGTPAAEHAAHCAATGAAPSPATTAAQMATLPTAAEALAGTEDLPWDIVWNIDPPGCRDVDDVLCVRQEAPNTLLVAISIADVAAWVPAGSALDIAAAQAATSVYDAAGTVLRPMLPPALSEGAASLRCDGTVRPTLAWMVRCVDGCIVETNWRRLALRVTAAHTYDDVLAAAEAPLLKQALCTVLGDPGLGDDPHVWVERAMLLYNTEAARCLRAAGAGLLRIHMAATEASHWPELAARTGCADIAHLGAAAGRYVAANGAQADVGHAGLALAHYCHASSPLRRYADLVNQRVLRTLVSGSAAAAAAAPATPLPRLHAQLRICKDMERELFFLSRVKMDSLTQVEGVVLWQKLDDTDRTITAYIPEWKRKCKVRNSSMTLYEPGARIPVAVYFHVRAVRREDRIVCTVAG